MSATILTPHKKSYPCYVYDLDPGTAPLAHLLCEGRGMRFYVSSNPTIAGAVEQGHIEAARYTGKGLYFFVVSGPTSHFLSGGPSDLQREFPLTAH